MHAIKQNERYFGQIIDHQHIVLQHVKYCMILHIFNLHKIKYHVKVS